MDQDGITNKPGPPPPKHTPPHAPAGATQPIAVPDHELLRCIGVGSYGAVWLARNVMGLYRAVKIVRRQSFDNARPFERELSGIRKFEPISRSHEGFVDVLHIGNNEAEGAFYYVMELGDDRVSGQVIEPEKYGAKTLATEISRCGKLSFEECLQLGLALSRALAELHKSGLVHRDIKPSNIIFVLGVPKLADIGLVADVGEARSYVGTEGFIPPEGPGGPQADIYSLGKVLYEAATGKDRQDFPGLPTLWDKSPDHDRMLELNEIILQACANDTATRYQTAGEMHAHLVLLSNGQSLRRLKVLERRFSNLKRAARLALLVVAVLAALVFLGYREWRNKIESRQVLVGGQVAYGNAAMESGNLLGSLPHYADALRSDQGSEGRELTHRVRFGCVLAQSPKLTHLWFASGQVDDAQFSPDGKSVLIAEHFGQAKIYDLPAGDLPPRSFGSGPGFTSATYSPNGRWILTTSRNQTASLWDAATLEQTNVFPHSAWIYSGRFSPDSRRFVTACKDGRALVWDASTGELLFPIPAHSEPVRFAAFSPDGKWIVTASEDETAAVWDAQDGQPAKHGRLKHPNWVTHAAFSSDSQRVITSCEDHHARVWERESGRRIPPDLKHRDVGRSVEFSPDGRFMLTAALDGVVRLWNATNQEPVSLNSLLTHRERVMSAAFDPAGQRVVVACADGSIWIWDLAGSATPPAPMSRRYSPGGDRFLALTNQSAQVFDALTGVAVGPPLKFSV